MTSGGAKKTDTHQNTPSVSHIFLPIVGHMYQISISQSWELCYKYTPKNLHEAETQKETHLNQPQPTPQKKKSGAMFFMFGFGLVL